MNNFFLQLKNIARTLRLSSDEKQRMRVTLYKYLEMNPAEAPAVSRMPRRAIPSPYYWYSPRFAVPLSVVLILGLGSGTAFAAQGALPSSPLYAVKVHVNEPLRVALATTPQAKAEVNADIATTRLEEAETLAANGALDASTSQVLADNFTAHAAAAEQNTTELENQDPGTAVELGAQFSSTLAAHQAILAQIGDDSKDAATADNSNAIAMAVRASEHDEDNGDNDNGNDTGAPVTLALATATAATATPAAAPAAGIRTFAAKTNAPRAASTTATTTASTTPAQNAEAAKGSARDSAVALALETQASSSLADVIGDLALQKAQLDPAVAAQVQVQIQNAQTAFVNGKASLAAKNTSAAKNQFTTVIRTTVKLDTYLTVGKKLNIKLLNSLFNMSTDKPASSGSDGSGNKGSGSSSSATTTTVEPSSNSGSSDSASGSGQSGDGKNGDSSNGGSNDGDSSGSVNVNLHL